MTDLDRILDVDHVACATDPASYMATALARAKAWLAQPLRHTDIDQILDLKTRADQVRTHILAHHIGKDAELDAAEIMRRAERGLGLALRRSQEEGVVARRGENPYYGDRPPTKLQ